MAGDKTGHCKTLTLYWAWLCVDIYALCEALNCHVVKCQVRYFAKWLRNFCTWTPLTPRINGCWLKRLRGWVNVLTWQGRNVVTRARPVLARTLTDPELLYRFIRLWTVFLEQPKWCAISFTVDPTLSTPIIWFLWSFERRAVAKCKRFVTMNHFLSSVLSCKCYLVSFKVVSEPPVPEQVQRKEHVFQALTLE